MFGRATITLGIGPHSSVWSTCTLIILWIIWKIKFPWSYTDSQFALIDPASLPGWTTWPYDDMKKVGNVLWSPGHWQIGGRWSLRSLFLTKSFQHLPARNCRWVCMWDEYSLPGSSFSRMDESKPCSGTWCVMSWENSRQLRMCFWCYMHRRTVSIALSCASAH